MRVTKANPGKPFDKSSQTTYLNKLLVSCVHRCENKTTKQCALFERSNLVFMFLIICRCAVTDKRTARNFIQQKVKPFYYESWENI